MKNKRMITLLFLLLLWHFSAIMIGNDILLPSVKQVLCFMASQLTEIQFYEAFLITLKRMLQGLFGSLFCAFILIVLEDFFSWMRQLIEPIITLIKAIPTVSYIILALIWFKQEGCVRFISFMVIFPLFYSALQIEMKKFNDETKELLTIYPVSRKERIVKLALPMLLPSLLNSFKLAFGMGLKASVMAEIMAAVRFGIGREMKLAQNNLVITEIFAWTVWIIFICLLVDVLIDYLCNQVEKIFNES